MIHHPRDDDLNDTLCAHYHECDSGSRESLCGKNQNPQPSSTPRGALLFFGTIIYRNQRRGDY